jgi:hypothetical protein
VDLEPEAQRVAVVALTTDRVIAEKAVMDVWANQLDISLDEAVARYSRLPSMRRRSVRL